MYYRWMWSTGINRNIVECKATRKKKAWPSKTVLIETLWNVKRRNWITWTATWLVLIETLWNVKKIDTKNVKSAVNVLIETLWNVKFCRGTEMHRPVLVLIETLWNVKIMEVSGSMLSLKVVLIETLWNVKWKISQVYWSLRAGINRNIVECKDGICTYQIRSRSVLIETLWNVKCA